jgi:two-component system sensor histidine kinase ChiS
MPTPSLRRSLTNLAAKLPLRAILIIPFVVQILLVAGLIGFLSFRNGQSAVRSLATQLEAEIGQRIEQTLETYLKMPQLTDQITADAVRQGLLKLDSIDPLQEYLWSQFRQFNNQYLTRLTGEDTSIQQPDDISLLGIGTEQGDYVDVGYYLKNSRLTMSLRDRRQDDTLRIWRLSQWGNRVQIENKTPRYDPRSREWYQQAVQAGRMIWVGPYHSASPDNDYVISANQPLYDKQGNLVGVADATLSLRSVNQFLANLQIGQSGQVFIIKLNGELLATSKPDGEVTTSQQVVNSSDLLTQETAVYLRRKFGSFDQIAYRQRRQPQQLEFRDSRHKKQFVRIQPLRKQQYPGLDWLVVITVPEDDFMGQIRQNTLLTVLLCLLGSAGAILFGIAAGRWLTRPIVQLSRAAEGLSRGEWERPVTIQRSGELGVLVSAFNQMRQELRQSQQQLEEYSQGLEQKNEQLQTLEVELRRQLNLFLHAVSHDLRNPVLGTAMVLNNLSAQSGDQIKLPRQILERMQESNQRQLDLINSLIDTHAAEIWGIALYPKRLALKPLVASALADLLPMMEKEQTHLENRIPEDLPLVEVDPLQLARVYQNLLANALKHNPNQLTVTLDAQLQADWVYCTVSDDGVGITPEQCERLFDPYFRGTSKPKSMGLGLGLYLCQQIVQAHGGQIGVKSQPGKGTMFWFTLPTADKTSSGTSNNGVRDEAAGSEVTKY